MRDLEYLVEAWPVLVHLRVPGSPRSWVERPRRPGVLTPEDAERMGPRGTPHKAPADVAVLDLLWQIAAAASELVRTLAAVVEVDGRPPVSVSVDPRPWLRLAASLLPDAHVVDEHAGPWVAGRIRASVSSAARLLGDVRDGQVLDGICPWCGGRTERGVGERTMVVRHPDARDEDDEPLIVCRGLNCTPPSAACGSTSRGHPAWPTREWDWLAKQIHAAR